VARRRERQEERGSFQHPFRKKLLRFTVRHLAVNQPGGKETRPPPPEDAFNAAANAAPLSGFAGEPPYAVMSNAPSTTLSTSPRSAFQGTNPCPVLCRFTGDILPRNPRRPRIVLTRTGVTRLQNLGGLVFVQLALLVSEFTPALDDRGGL
jgi:hypothetical protein